jgi:hypothetical protein
VICECALASPLARFVSSGLSRCAREDSTSTDHTIHRVTGRDGGVLRNQNVAVVRYHAAPPIADAVQRAARAVGADAIVELAPLPSTGAASIRSRP